LRAPVACSILCIFILWSELSGTPRDALALYPWSGNVNWCLAEG